MKNIITLGFAALSFLSVATVAARADYFGNDPRTLTGQNFNDKFFSDLTKTGGAHEGNSILQSQTETGGA